MTEAQEEALAMLDATHVFLTVEATHKIQDAFGLPRRLQSVRCNTGEPKGLSVEGEGCNATVEGYASHDMADVICDWLGLAIPGLFGRGSRQRYAVAAIRKHLLSAPDSGDSGQDRRS